MMQKLYYTCGVYNAGGGVFITDPTCCIILRKSTKKVQSHSYPAAVADLPISGGVHGGELAPN